MSTLLPILSLLTLSLAAAPEERPVLIRGARIFDGQKLVKADSVLIQNGVIRKLGRALAAPAGAEVVDAAGCTLLPGLIDAHVHCYGEALRQNLAFGVTTVIDLFTDPSLVRQAKAKNAPGVADIRSAGLLATCAKGHGTEYPVRVPTLERPEQAEAWVQARIQEGSDFIKVVLDDGHLFGFSIPTLSPDTVRALVAAAHRHGKKVVVHVSDLASARLALEAGADGLAHAWCDAAPAAALASLASLAKAKGAFVMPTLSVCGDPGPERLGLSLAEDPDLKPWLTPEGLATLRSSARPIPAGSSPAAPDHAQAAVRALLAAGVPLLAGTDAPNPGTAHGISLHGELELLVKAGLTPLQALQAATRIPAFQFGLSDRGSIARDQRADLVLVKGDPCTDIRATRKIVAVWKAGVRFDRDGYAKELDQARQQAAAAQPLAPGLVCDFSHGLTTREGSGWHPSTDTVAGGNSSVDLQPGPDSVLNLAGVIDGKLPFAWAGAMWMPGGAFDQPRDFSALTSLRFRARCSGSQSFRVMLFTRDSGFMPVEVRFATSPDWTEHNLALTRFPGAGLKAVTAVVFAAGPKPGPFSLDLADIRLQ